MVEEKSTESSEEGKNLKYAPVSLSKIRSDVPLPADIYLLISEKYLRFKGRGDVLSAEKHDYFLSKNVRQIYIAFKELSAFKEWIKKQRLESVDESLEEMGGADKPELRAIAEKREDIKEALYETLADKEITAENIQVLKDNVTQFIADVQELEEPGQILAALLKRNESLAEHSANVANLSVCMALILGVGRKAQLEHLYLGGLLHDYGQAKIPPEILENQGNSLYSQAIQNHPLEGAKMLKTSKNIAEQVIRIVEEHHEQYNGQGFPKGLKYEEMYELSRVVAMANIYDEELQKNKERNKEAYIKAAKFLGIDRGIRFHPEEAKRVSEALLETFKS